MDQRVFHASTDISAKVNDFRAGVHTFSYTSGQYLYIGSVLPLNNLWFEIGTANDVAATLSIDIWYGGAWVSAVDIMDETSGLFTTGRISWNTDIGKSWDREAESRNVTGLPASSRIFDMYWMRMSWNVTLKATTTLKYIGQKFSIDSVLESIYPDLRTADIKTAFATDKTTWDEQHYIAAEEIIGDLKQKDIIVSREQIMDYKLFEKASCHKIAEIVYRSFGQPYFEQLAEAKKDYSKAMAIKFPNVDLNADGKLDDAEKRMNISFLTR